MLGIIWLLAFLGCGVIISYKLISGYSSIIKCWIGMCIGFALAMWLPTICAFAMRFTVAAQWVALGLAAVITFCVWKFVKSFQPTRIQHDTPPIAVFLLLVIPLTLLGGYLQYTHNLREVEGALYVGQSTYSDINLHMSLITGLRNAQFPANYAILPTARLCYPFLTDALSSSMYMLGTGLGDSMTIPSTIMMMLVFGGYALLAWRLTKKSWVMALCVLFLFVNGGFGFAYMVDLVVKDPSRFIEIFTGYYKTPANLPDPYNLRWSNIIVDMMVPQRTFLAGWTLLMPAMYLLLEAIRRNQRRLFILVGIIAGCMPMINTHAFLALGLATIGFMVWQLIHAKSGSALLDTDQEAEPSCAVKSGKPKRGSLLDDIDEPVSLASSAGKSDAGSLASESGIAQAELFAAPGRKSGSARMELFKNYLWYGVIALAMALPQILIWTINQASTGNFLKLHFNWVNNNGASLIDEYFWFWIKNIGPAALLIIPAFFDSKREQRMVAVGAFVIFAVAETIVFQPLVYDNNKLFYVWYLLMLPVVMRYVERLWNAVKAIRGRAFLMTLFVAVGLFSGSLSIGREVISDFQLYSALHVEAMQYVEANTPEDAVFLTGDQHNNPVASLAGRQLVCGSTTFVHFHGLDYAEAYADRAAMLTNPTQNQDLFAKYNVDYIYISSNERHDFTIDEPLLASLYPIWYQSGEITIYAVSDRAQAQLTAVG